MLNHQYVTRTNSAHQNTFTDMEPLTNEPPCQAPQISIENLILPEAEEIPDYKWYVLRASYGRAQKAENIIAGQGIITFLPMECKSTVINGQRHWKKVPCTPSHLFVYCTYKEARSFTHRDTSSRQSIPYVDFNYDHTAHETDGRDKIMTVPFRQMQNFIRIVLAAIPESYSVTPQEIHYRPGGKVRITEGPFKGVTGHVARIHSQQRVVVTIPGVISFATTYIPKAFLEPIE